MADFQNTAQGLAALGRGGDSTLVHMNPSEVAGLQNLAARNGTSLTVNPNTGMPEAFNLRGLIPMVVGGGLTAATGGAISPLMAGLMVGGATAVMSGDIMSGLGAGLGAYGGGSLAEGFNLAAGGVEAAGGTTAAANEAVINQSLVNANPTLAAGNSLTAGGTQGFSTGTMGIDGAANTVTGNYPAAFQNNPVNSNVLGQGKIPQANLQSASARGYQYTPNEIAGRAADNAIYNNYTNVGGYTSAAQPTVANTTNSTMPSYMNQTGAQQATNNAGGITDALSIRDINAVSANNSGLGSISVDSVSDNLSRTGEGFKNVVTDYSATRDAMGLTDGEMAMKFGLPIAGGIAGGLEESDFQPDPVDMAQFEDRRYRGPDGQLNLSGESGLNLNNPYGYTAGGYGYAVGGAVKQGMEAALARNSGVASITSGKGMSDALARNEGIAYTPSTTTTAYTPPSTNVGASNINVGGFRGTPSNLTGAMGSLNVSSGTIGQSPNAIAEAARLKAIEDAKPKMKTVYGGMGSPLGFGPQQVPINYNPGNIYQPASHYKDREGNWQSGINPNPPGIYGYMAQGGAVRGYAEGGYLGGGDVNVQGDGMSDDIPANIDNEQPAALSEGEFVVPADVVSHIGNGSSEAGAKEFYGMMDRVRMARTGRKKQSPEIDPERFMPA